MPEFYVLSLTPRTFAALKSNITENNLSDIEIINSAVSDSEGQISFYGQVALESPNVLGNSILNDWGIQQPVCSEIKVQAVCLSNYIDREVDFLKLDIEGAEQQVITEIEDKLRYIKELHIEIHETEIVRNYNNTSSIRKILERHGFSICWLRESTGIWPPETGKWVKDMRPKLYSLRAIRK